MSLMHMSLPPVPDGADGWEINGTRYDRAEIDRFNLEYKLAELAIVKSKIAELIGEQAKLMREIQDLEKRIDTRETSRV